VARGGHFGFWISSLRFTSVAASVVLVSTQPVFVAVLAYLVLSERTTPVSFAGTLVALAGTAVIAADRTVGSAALSGNVLALVGAVTVGVYVLIGRSSRTGGVGVLPYSVVVYSATAASLLPAALVFDAPLWDYSGESRLWLAAITPGPQLMAHTVFNWAPRYVEASVISGLALAEPVISALLAWLVLSERPRLLTLLGGAVVLSGLYFLLKGRPVPVEPVA
jgi:drug/metabolite transporter (DMT)-like permease